MSRVLLIRHAETDMAGRFCGHSDPELNQRGRAQLAALGELLSTEPIERVYSSDLRRARSTAESIAAARDLSVELRPNLREIYFGQWEGLSWNQIEATDRDYATHWMAAYPGLPAPAGEAFAAFTTRVMDEVNRLCMQAGAIAVVTHAGVLRVILQNLCGYSEAAAWEQTQSYCSIVHYEPGVRGETK